MFPMKSTKLPQLSVLGRAGSGGPRRGVGAAGSGSAQGARQSRLRIVDPRWGPFRISRHSHTTRIRTAHKAPF